ncbi:MAG TPA: CheR family methyltransferase [Methylophilaceae bacterium]|jgi:chemotaxis protein methyltransferase CheR
MSHLLSDSLLHRLSEFLMARIGLYFPEKRWSDLERGMVSAAKELGKPELEACAHWLLSAELTQRQIEIIASHLTVGETYFFRDEKFFEALEQTILPALIRTRRDSGQYRIRIWSAACCTGEEPYSIAMLLDRLLPDQEPWNITILATDINPKFLKKATDGIYGEWSFRGTPGWVKERYFKNKRQGQFELHAAIKKRVTFTYLNLADQIYPSLLNNTNAMDLILCRNVLMYFGEALTKKVTDNLSRALMKDGWLAVSATETSQSLFPELALVNFPGAMFYHKDVAGSAQPRRSEYLDIAVTMPVMVPALKPAMPILAQDIPAIPAEAFAVPASQQDTPEMLRAKAWQCANRGELAEAADWCRQAIAVDRLNPQTHYLFATILQELDQLHDAQQALKRAIYLDPNFILAHFTLGNLCLSQGHWRDAERHFDNTQVLLNKYPQDAALPEAEGLTAGRLDAIIASARLSLPHAAVSA